MANPYPAAISGIDAGERNFAAIPVRALDSGIGRIRSQTDAETIDRMLEFEGEGMLACASPLSSIVYILDRLSCLAGHHRIFRY